MRLPLPSLRELTVGDKQTDPLGASCLSLEASNHRVSLNYGASTKPPYVCIIIPTPGSRLPSRKETLSACRITNRLCGMLIRCLQISWPIRHSGFMSGLPGGCRHKMGINEKRREADSRKEGTRHPDRLANEWWIIDQWRNHLLSSVRLIIPERFATTMNRINNWSRVLANWHY